MSKEEIINLMTEQFKSGLEAAFKNIDEIVPVGRKVFYAHGNDGWYEGRVESDVRLIRFTKAKVRTIEEENDALDIGGIDFT